MKKFEKFIVLFSVKYSSIFFVLCLFIISIGVIGRIPVNNFKLITFVSAIISLIMHLYFQKIDNTIYENVLNLTNADINDDEVFYSRGKTLWLSILIGAVFFTFFASMSINNMFTSKDSIILVDGKIKKEFMLIDPFRIKKVVNIKK